MVVAALIAGSSLIARSRRSDPTTFLSRPDVAVAASTLLGAALARPLQRRVRRSVDRRFDRSHDDAEVLTAGRAAVRR